MAVPTRRHACGIALGNHYDVIKGSAMCTESPMARSGWRKSSYSTSTGNCVEVDPRAEGVVVRHSKHPDAGTVAFSFGEWVAFLRDVRDRGTRTNGVVVITAVGTDTVVRSLGGEVELRFDDGEWTAFLAGVEDGEFDFANPVAVAG